MTMLAVMMMVMAAMDVFAMIAIMLMMVTVVMMAVAVLVAMVLANVLGLASTLEAAMLAAGLMLALRCVSVNRSRMNVSVNLPVLVVIGASFALGKAMESSGAAAWIVELAIPDSGLSPFMALVIVYLLTAIFTEMITNNAAAVLVFPIAIGVAEQLGVSPMPFIVAVMFEIGRAHV